MPDFAHPAFLGLLPLPPLLFVWWLRRRRPALRYPATSAFAGLPVGRARRVRFLGALLRALGALTLVLAVAGPRWPDLKTRIPTEGVAIVLALDVSGSMAGSSKESNSFVWQPGSSERISRLEAARRAFRLFVEGGDAPDGTHFEGRSTERGTDRIGLVTFTACPQPVCLPTLNHSVVLAMLDEARSWGELAEGTNIGDAIVEGLNMLESAGSRRKVLILLSDGEHNFDLADPERRPFKPLQAAKLSASLGIPIYVIDAGGELPPDARPEAIQQRLDGRRVNEAVAEMTGGKAFTANNGADMLEVCRTIDRLERQPVLSYQYRRYHEAYPWLAAASLVLLAGAFGLDQTRWRRLP